MSCSSLQKRGSRLCDDISKESRSGGWLMVASRDWRCHDSSLLVFSFPSLSIWHLHLHRHWFFLFCFVFRFHHLCHVIPQRTHHSTLIMTFHLPSSTFPMRFNHDHTITSVLRVESSTRSIISTCPPPPPQYSLEPEDSQFPDFHMHFLDSDPLACVQST